jgi:hypothetical protein
VHCCMIKLSPSHHVLCWLATGEFYEVKCHEGPVARLRVSYDDFLLVSAGEDGSVVMLDIRDKELAKASSRQQQVRHADIWFEECMYCIEVCTAGVGTWMKYGGLSGCSITASSVKDNVACFGRCMGWHDCAACALLLTAVVNRTSPCACRRSCHC